MADEPTYRLRAESTFRAPPPLEDEADERGLIRAGEVFAIESGDPARDRMRRLLLHNNLAIVPETEIVHRGGGWYDVIGEAGRILNGEALKGGDEARAFVEEHGEDE